MWCLDRCEQRPAHPKGDGGDIVSVSDQDSLATTTTSASITGEILVLVTFNDVCLIQFPTKALRAGEVFTNGSLNGLCCFGLYVECHGLCPVVVGASMRPVCLVIVGDRAKRFGRSFGLCLACVSAGHRHTDKGGAADIQFPAFCFAAKNVRVVHVVLPVFVGVDT